ncbi:MAG: 50S ribosomal protein L35 [Clostridia bacterium]|nr:50S ribosomal protein L35 [Clostridia bacterium]MBR3195424.1 50S ribosomal protein L35 [Clostridia bacterium]
MPKMKTRRAAAKRFSITESGKIKRSKAFKSHLLNGKTRKRKRNLRKGTVVDSTVQKNMRELIPYK